MRTLFKISFLTNFFLILGCREIHAQSSFINLNFEVENIPAGTPAGTVVTVPGWTASTYVYYDDTSTGGALVTINDSMSPYLTFTPLQGNYSVILWAGPDVGAAGASAIEQTGLVPAGSQSILMDIGTISSGAVAEPFTVTLGGQQIAMVPVQTYANYTVYGGNIAAEAGLSEALIITESPPPPPVFPPSAIALDNIVFSPMAIPEPSTWALMVCGTGLIGVLRRKNEVWRLN